MSFPVFLGVFINFLRVIAQIYIITGGNLMDNTLYLVLENGKVFKGYSIGAKGEVIGETVFQTAVLGYNETLTDPKYYGQIVVQTFPLVGNYGIIEEELETIKPVISGYIVKSICDTPSNFRSEGKLEDYMKENGIVGLAGIDTRELTRVIRENGTMNGKITADITDIDKIIKELKEHKTLVDYSYLSVDEIEEICVEDSLAKVCLYDLGATNAFYDILTKSRLDVTVVPYNTKAEDILKISPDGVIVSEGPGNPENCSQITEEIKKITQSGIPVYGCGLGHQIVALAMGAKTKKHLYGHRGANQPVKDTQTDKIYITNQNHGYIVDENSLPSNAKISFVNVNDKTIEGIEYTAKKVMSTQFMPNLCKGPHNTKHIIDRFVSIMKGDK